VDGTELAPSSMAIKLRPKQRLAAAMLISLAFFVTELAGQLHIPTLGDIQLII